MRFSAYSVSLPRGVGRSSIVEGGGNWFKWGGGGGLDQKSGGTWGGGCKLDQKSGGGQTGLSGIFIFSSG